MQRRHSPHVSVALSRNQVPTFVPNQSDSDRIARVEHRGKSLFITPSSLGKALMLFIWDSFLAVILPRSSRYWAVRLGILFPQGSSQVICFDHVEATAGGRFFTPSHWSRHTKRSGCGPQCQGAPNMNPADTCCVT